MKHPHLHPLFDQQRATIEFRVVLPQASAYVVLTQATMEPRFPVPEADLACSSLTKAIETSSTRR